MAVAEPNESRGSGAKKNATGGKNLTPNQLEPRRYSPGEFQTLLEIEREFGHNKLVVEITETKTTRAVRVMADTAERSRFVAYLLDELNRKQALLTQLYPDIKG